MTSRMDQGRPGFGNQKKPKTDAYLVLGLAEAAQRAATGRDEAPEAALKAVADDVNPAVEYLIERNQADALRLVGALSFFWQDMGQIDEGRSLTDRALKDGHHNAARDPKIAAAIPRALLTASELAFRQGDQEVAHKRAHEAIRAAILIEDRVTAALAHVNLARVAYRKADAPEIEKHARKALELGGNDTLARRGGLHMLAWAAHTAGNMAEAERRFEESLAYRRQVAGGFSVASELANLADLAAERGNVARAAALHAEALEISRDVKSAYLMVNTLPSIAALAAKAGADEDAARLFGAAEAAAKASSLVPDPGADMADARAEVRERLGTQRFDELARQGAELNSDDAVALARNVANRMRAAETTLSPY